MLNKFLRWTVHYVIASLWLFLAPLTHLLSIRRNKRCPPPNDPLLFYSATKLADMIRNRKIRSEEVVAAYIQRCKEANPYLNAVVEPRYEAALREARAVDVMLAGHPEKTPKELSEEQPLLGVPLTVKESIAVQGMSNDAGCVKPSRVPAKCDATTVRLARAAGAIPIAVTNTPQLCMHWETYNYVTGLTMNPYHQKRTVGGSSGGEAALLSAGASVVGIGSDIAGSLRLPAMFTGVYGHKPTPHVVSTEGHNPGCTDPRWDDFFALGPMTRYAEDLPLMLGVLSDTRKAQLHLDKEVDVKRIKLVYMAGDTSGVADAAGAHVRQAMKRVRQHFHSIGVEAQEVKIKNSQHIWELSTRKLLGLKNVGNIYCDEASGGKWRSVWPEVLKKIFCLSHHLFTCVFYGVVYKFNTVLPRRDVDKMEKLLQEIKDEFSEVLKGDCVLLYPTYPNTAHVHYQAFYRFLNFSYLTAFNLLGLPVTQCPLGLTDDGLPVGIQLVAERYNDRLTMAVARELERAFGGWVPPNAERDQSGKSSSERGLMASQV